MLTFLTLFFHLTLGPQPVELHVTPPITSVEVVLDGRTVARLTRPPWKTEVDFGPELLPHRLEIVGRDADGIEVERKDQWVNLPRERVHVAALVNPAQEGKPPTARVLFKTAENLEPVALRASLDGEELDVSDPTRIPLPTTGKADDGTVRLLSAEVSFKGGVTARGDTLVGGGHAGLTAGELTAVPVELLPDAELPAPEAMKDWVRVDGRPVPVVAVERGPADVVVVHDQNPGMVSALGRLGQRVERTAGMDTTIPRYGTRAGDTIRLLFPTANRGVGPEGEASDLFPVSLDLSSRLRGGLLSLLTSPFQPSVDVEPARKQRLSDAVATAGVTAAATRRPALVILVAAPGSPDASRVTPEQATRYLESLGVPLLVWSPFPTLETSPWGPVTDVSAPRRLDRALAEVRSALDRRAVLWIDGRHLPQEVTLGSGAARSLQIRRTAEGPR